MTQEELLKFINDFEELDKKEFEIYRQKKEMLKISDENWGKVEYIDECFFYNYNEWRSYTIYQYEKIEDFLAGKYFFGQNKCEWKTENETLCEANAMKSAMIEALQKENAELKKLIKK